MFQESIYKTHEIKEIFCYLDALQIRTDALLFSKDNPEEDQSLNSRNGSHERLEYVFGKDSISNREMDLVLKEIHLNYVNLGKELISVDEDGEPANGMLRC